MSEMTPRMAEIADELAEIELKLAASETLEESAGLSTDLALIHLEIREIEGDMRGLFPTAAFNASYRAAKGISK